MGFSRLNKCNANKCNQNLEVEIAIIKGFVGGIVLSTFGLYIIAFIVGLVK